MAPVLPSFAPFPEAPWRDHIVPEEWEACLSLWVSLAEAHLALSDADFSNTSARDESIERFLDPFMKETACEGTRMLGSSASASSLLRLCYLLTSRLLKAASTPPAFLQWEFLADFSKIYGKKRVAPVLSALFKKPKDSPDSSLHALKKSLILALDTGIKGDLRVPEAGLKQLNHLIHASPETAELFLAGDDFVDGLVSCYKLMNPPLRKAIIATAYLCLIGLTEAEPPRFSMLTDQLYSLKAAAEAHKAGPTNANDSMVAELVTVTPILKQVQRRLETSGSTTARLKPVITALEGFRKPGGSVRPKRLVKRKVDKGKGKAPMTEEDDGPTEMRVHRMSQITQIQDLFPDLGTGFVSRLLDEYKEDTEQVVAHLLEDSLPSHLASADRSKELYVAFSYGGTFSTEPITDRQRGPGGGEAASYRIRRRPSSPFDTTCLMMTSSINCLLMSLNSVSASAIPARQQTICSRTGPLRPTRPPFFLPFLPLMRTMMSVTILMMLLTLVSL